MNKNTNYKTFIPFWLSLSLFFCQPELPKNSAEQALLLAGISSGCSTLDDCFDRYAKTTDEGVSLQVFDSSMNRIYARQNTLSYDTYKPIASGSKWVAAVIAMRAIDCSAGLASNCGNLTNNRCQAGGANLSLSTTMSQALGWTGTYAPVTLRQLLSFTSGLTAGGGGGSGQATCIATLPAVATDAQKDECIETIRTGSTGTPGALFHYNSNHMAVAARVLEKSCGLTWNEIFTSAIVTPLGWDPTQAVWRGNFQSATTSADGSLSGAYGLSISPEHYSRMMSALLRTGTARSASADVTSFLTSASVNEILNDQYGSAKIGYSQFSAFGFQWQYGLGNWRYCTATSNPTECDKDLISHSIGINGFYPWIDRNRRYFGVLAVNNIGRKNGLPLLPASSTSLFFSETIRPLIHRLLGVN